MHDDVIKWKLFPHHWPFVLGIHRALCAGNSPITGEFLSQRPVTRSFNVFFYLRLSKRLCKQPRRRWFEMPSGPLWRHHNGISVTQAGSESGMLTRVWQYNACSMHDKYHKQTRDASNIISLSISICLLYHDCNCAFTLEFTNTCSWWGSTITYLYLSIINLLFDFKIWHACSHYIAKFRFWTIDLFR